MIEPVRQQIQNVKDAFLSVRNLRNYEIRSHSAKYICILISASLEVCLEAIFLRFAQKHSGSESVYRYVESHLLRHSNPNRGNIVNLHNRFDKQWGKKIENFIQDQKSDAIASVVNNRNNIAHGRDCSVNIHQLRKWFTQIEKVIAFSHDLVLETAEEAHAPGRGDEGGANG